MGLVMRGAKPCNSYKTCFWWFKFDSDIFSLVLLENRHFIAILSICFRKSLVDSTYTTYLYHLGKTASTRQTTANSLSAITGGKFWRTARLSSRNSRCTSWDEQVSTETTATASKAGTAYSQKDSKSPSKKP